LIAEPTFYQCEAEGMGSLDELSLLCLGNGPPLRQVCSS